MSPNDNQPLIIISPNDNQPLIIIREALRCGKFFIDERKTSKPPTLVFIYSHASHYQEAKKTSH